MNYFETIYRYNPDTIDLNSPIELCEVAIIKDTVDHEILLRNIFGNVSNGDIVAISIKIQAWNILGEILKINDKDSVNYIYQDMVIEPMQLYGNKIPIKLPNDARKVNVTIEKIVSKNGNIWTNESSLIVKKPQQKEINNINEVFSFISNDNNVYLPVLYYAETSSCWQCTCGKINKIKNLKCDRCGREKRTVEKFYSEDYIESKRREKQEAELKAKEEEKRRIEKEREERNKELQKMWAEQEKNRAEREKEEERKNKNKKRKIIIFSALTVAVFVLIIIVALISWAKAKKITEEEFPAILSNLVNNRAGYFKTTDMEQYLDSIEDTIDDIEKINRYLYAMDNKENLAFIENYMDIINEKYNLAKESIEIGKTNENEWVATIAAEANAVNSLYKKDIISVADKVYEKYAIIYMEDLIDSAIYDISSEDCTYLESAKGEDLSNVYVAEFEVKNETELNFTKLNACIHWYSNFGNEIFLENDMYEEVTVTYTYSAWNSDETYKGFVYVPSEIYEQMNAYPYEGVSCEADIESYILQK